MDHKRARVAALAAHASGWLATVHADEHDRLDREWRRLETLHYEQYTSGRCTFVEQRRRRVRGMHAALGRAAPSDTEADRWFGEYLRHYERRGALSTTSCRRSQRSARRIPRSRSAW